MAGKEKLRRRPESLPKIWRQYLALFLIVLGLGATACSSGTASKPDNPPVPSTDTPTLPLPNTTATLTRVSTPITASTKAPLPTVNRMVRATPRRTPEPTKISPKEVDLDWQKMTDAQIDATCPCSDIYEFGPDYEVLARVILMPSGGLGYDGVRIPVGYRAVYNADFAPNSTSRSAEMDLFAPDQYNLIPDPNGYDISYVKKKDAVPVARIRTSLEPRLGWGGHNLHFEGGRGYPQGAIEFWQMNWRNLDPNHPARIIVRSTLLEN